MNQIDSFLKMAIEKQGSDLHLLAGDPARVRVNGDLQVLHQDRLNPDDVRDMLLEIMHENAREVFSRRDGCDFAYAIHDVARFRVNVFRHLGGMGAVFRAIPNAAMSFEELGLPEVMANMCLHKQGMILVTGKTGSGKSTTLAAMIDYINARKACHIITIEDPIEFVHYRKKALISQREVGIHTESFASALHSALREDPDVVLVGELRDLETVSIAVTAAETGILVMGTLHTNGAAPTVDRLINMFDVERQSHIRTMLSTSLRGVVSQQLVKRKDDKGRLAALEILVNTSAIGNLIRQGKIDQLENAIQSGGAVGMRSMDSSLKELLDRRFIDGEEAYMKAFNKKMFELYAPREKRN